jgi:hypothetical protein
LAAQWAASRVEHGQRLVAQFVRGDVTSVAACKRSGGRASEAFDTDQRTNQVE